MSCWYLIHTKLRQERVVLESLQRQGYECFLPLMRHEKLHSGALHMVEELMFPRCLFIRLSADPESPSPIHHMTSPVSRLLSFGHTPVQISEALIASIRAQTASAMGPEAAFSMSRGEDRVISLLNALSQAVKTQMPSRESSTSAVGLGLG